MNYIVSVFLGIIQFGIMDKIDFVFLSEPEAENNCWNKLFPAKM